MVDSQVVLPADDSRIPTPERSFPATISVDCGVYLCFVEWPVQLLTLQHVIGFSVRRDMRLQTCLIVKVRGQNLEVLHPLLLVRVLFLGTYLASGCRTIVLYYTCRFLFSVVRIPVRKVTRFYNDQIWSLSSGSGRGLWGLDGVGSG